MHFAMRKDVRRVRHFDRFARYSVFQDFTMPLFMWFITRLTAVNFLCRHAAFIITNSETRDKSNKRFVLKRGNCLQGLMP